LLRPFWGWNFSVHKLTFTGVAILGHFFIPPFLAENSQIFGILLPQAVTTLLLLYPSFVAFSGLDNLALHFSTNCPNMLPLAMKVGIVVMSET